LKEGSLAALIFNEIEAHPNGICDTEIKYWLRSGNSRYANQPETCKRVYGMTGLRRNYGVIVKKDNGKWYPTAESSDFH
jgi:hypothetical protein